MAKAKKDVKGQGSIVQFEEDKPKSKCRKWQLRNPRVRTPERLSMPPRQGCSMAPIRRRPRRCVTSSMKSGRTRSKGWDCGGNLGPKQPAALWGPRGSSRGRISRYRSTRPAPAHPRLSAVTPRPVCLASALVTCCSPRPARGASPAREEPVPPSPSVNGNMLHLPCNYFIDIVLGELTNCICGAVIPSSGKGDWRQCYGWLLQGDRVRISESRVTNRFVAFCELE